MNIPLDSIPKDRRHWALSVGAGAVCQLCEGTGLAPFYEVRDVPVHSVTLLPTLDEALSYPTADVLLGFCGRCGFIQNLVYSSGVQDYSQDYEETQAFSPRFNEFADALAARLVDTYGLHNKDILEVGGGKGDFLALLCELGPNRGVGIDPAYVPDRLETNAMGRMVFHREFYSSDWTHLTGDLVCCRHTLEHIGPVSEFAVLLRQSAAHTPDSALFLEVPDTLRVLEERAFWDVYYEHCSYFTLGSFGRLANRAGLTVERLELEFDNQYIMLDACVGQTPGIELDDIEATGHAVADFATSSRAAIADWQERLSSLAQAGKRAVLWGAGSKAVAFLNTLGDVGIEYAVDINPFKHGTFLAGTGQECISPESLKQLEPDLVVAMNAIYLDEIGRDLDAMDLRPQLVAV